MRVPKARSATCAMQPKADERTLISSGETGILRSMITTRRSKTKTTRSMKYRVARGLAEFGLIATAPFKRGETIVEYTGEVIDKREADRREAAGNRYIMCAASDVFIDGSKRKNVGRYLNHSCRPNAFIRDRNRRVFYVAKRAIQAGEEITVNYGKEYFDLFLKESGCRCGEEKHLA